MIFYYDRISVKKGIDTITYEHNDSFINETISKRCDGCHIIFYNRRNFNYKEWTCDRCYKILLGAGFKPKNIYVIWWNNCKYRVLTTLKCGEAQRLMEKEKTQDRYGYINVDNSVKKLAN